VSSPDMLKLLAALNTLNILTQNNKLREFALQVVLRKRPERSQCGREGKLLETVKAIVTAMSAKAPRISWCHYLASELDEAVMKLGRAAPNSNLPNLAVKFFPPAGRTKLEGRTARSGPRCRKGTLVMPALKAFCSTPALAFFVGVTAPVPTRAFPALVVPAVLVALVNEVFCVCGGAHKRAARGNRDCDRSDIHRCAHRTFSPTVNLPKVSRQNSSAPALKFSMPT
jgi:hypothetical protein